MGANIAQRRAARANRRKAIVAQKRKAELIAATLPERVRAAAAAPIEYCLLSEGLFETGLGTLMLARGIGQLSLATFLIDVFCLGIKDVFFRPVGTAEFEGYLAAMESGVAMVAIDPSRARKLLRDAAGWARSIGFEPHRDFATVEQLFGDVNADACEEVFNFGREGKPFYVAGLLDTPVRSRAVLERVRDYSRAEQAEFIPSSIE